MVTEEVQNLGESKKFLDYTGLSYVINNLKSLFAFKTDIPEEYTHPVFPPHASGLYKITVDEQGHVTNTKEVTKNANQIQKDMKSNQQLVVFYVFNVKLFTSIV